MKGAQLFLALGLFFAKNCCAIEMPADIVELCKQPVKMIQQYPIVIAIVIVLVMQKEPWTFIKGIAEYFIEEHPFMSIALIALLLSGGYKDLLTFLKAGNTLSHYAYTACSLSFRMLNKALAPFAT